MNVFVVACWSNKLGAFKRVSSIHSRESDALKACDDYKKTCQEYGDEDVNYIVLKRHVM